MRQNIELSVWTPHPHTQLKIVAVYKKNETLVVPSSLTKCIADKSECLGLDTYERSSKIMIFADKLPIDHRIISNNIEIQRANVTYTLLVEKDVSLLEQKAEILYKPQSAKVYQDSTDLSKNIDENYIDNFPITASSSSIQAAPSSVIVKKQTNNYLAIGGLFAAVTAAALLSTGLKNAR